MREYGFLFIYIFQYKGKIYYDSALIQEKSASENPFSRKFYAVFTVLCSATAFIFQLFKH